MDALIDLEHIAQMYPDYMNDELPHAAHCKVQDGDLEPPFKRILPNMFKIKKVNLYTERKNCVLVAKYQLRDDNDLPTGPGLKALVNCLKKFTPSNTVIINDRICLPKYVEISYAVRCRCDRLDFEVPVHPSQVRVLQNSYWEDAKAFQKLKI